MFLSFYDFPEPEQILFQDPASPVMYFIIGAHNTIMFYLFIIVSIVIVLMIYIVGDAQVYFFSHLSLNKLFKNNYLSFKNFFNCFFKFHINNSFEFRKLISLNFLSNRLQKWFEENTLEMFWTEYPSVLIVILVFPVLIFLFAFEEVESAQWDFVIKVIGNQWFWSYELVYQTGEYDWFLYFNESAAVTKPDLLSFESRLLSENDLIPGLFRLLEVDNALVLPINTPIHVYVTSSDVIHSWSIPSLGIKIDAVPGRINAVSFTITRPGSFYGQCSELCGVNHFSMPIHILGIFKESVLVDYSDLLRQNYVNSL